MSSDPPVPELEELSRDECIDLIRSRFVGRIAVNGHDGGPHVVPVNYRLDVDVVVFRTDEGAKLSAIRDQAVTFQVDEIDPYHRTGWSVMVHGTATETDQPSDLDEAWAGGGKLHIVRIEPRTITGRRIRLAQLPTDQRGYL